jgi:hypothetical protein
MIPFDHSQFYYERTSLSFNEGGLASVDVDEGGERWN